MGWGLPFLQGVWKIKNFILLLFILVCILIPSLIITNNSFAEAKDSFYLGLNWGSKLSSDSNLSQYAVPDTSGSDSNYLTDLKIGYQFSNPFGLELGAEIGPTGSFSGSDAGGPVSSSERISTVFLMPTFRLPIQDNVFAGILINTFGFRLGESFLRDNISIPGGSAGAVSLNGNTEDFNFGLVYRLEQFIVGHFSLGFELSYDFNKFNGLNISNVSGSGTNIIAQTPQADLSGLSLKISLTYWFSLPFDLDKSNSKHDDFKWWNPKKFFNWNF